MKYLFNTYQKLGIWGLLVLMAFACTDNFSSLNEDPNAPKSAATTYLLTSAQHGLADNYYEGTALTGYFGNLYAEYWSENQYTAESRYNYRPGVVNTLWDDYYLNLNTLQQIIRQNHESPDLSAAYGNNANQIAVAKTLKAWAFEILTDVWGDVPYTGALQGASNPSPAYTSQDSVYMGILNSLTEASDSIDVDASGFTDGDILFGGNMAKWKKFANSLKMRAAIRISDVAPAKAEAAFKEAYNAGAMESNDDNALFTYLGDTPNNNPINQAYKTRNDFGVSKPLLDFMNDNDDPRRPAFANSAVDAPDSTYAGYPYGLAQGTATTYLNSDAPWSEPSDRVREATSPAIFMTYSEVLFDEAEAAQRGWIAADPAAKFAAAIKASMEYWDVSEAKATAYVNSHPYNAANWRTVIGRQKWVSLYLQGVQGWSVWRRLDFGILVPPAGGQLSVSFDTPIAVRYPYPTQEHNENGTHVDAAIKSQGFSADDQGQRLWWDTSANTPASN